MALGPRKKTTFRPHAEPKASATLLAFAQPLLDLMPESGPDEGRENVESVLKLASTVWSAVEGDRRNPEAAMVAQLRATLARAGPGSEQLLAMFDDLLERRRTLFGDDHRLILLESVGHRPDGELWVRAIWAPG